MVHCSSAARLLQLAYIRLCGLLLAVIGWVLCLTATGADEWRVWHSKDVPGTSPAKIWVGIWKVCFVDNPPEGEPTRQCQEFLEQHQSLPTEILIAQDLMPFASVVLSLAIACISFALWNIFHNVRPEKVFLAFFRVGGALTLLSAFITLIPVLWNMYSVVSNERIVFPSDFSLPALPNEQTVGFPIYVGSPKPWSSAYALDSSLQGTNIMYYLLCSPYHKTLAPLLEKELEKMMGTL
uniref:Uncharacterized protein n=1 Tax=Anolis carolinensis TaxID=28377 RepID=A0A803TSU0_ANOCA